MLKMESSPIHLDHYITSYRGEYYSINRYEMYAYSEKVSRCY